MSHYEFSLRQEVLLEKGAGILGDIFHYEQQNQIQDEMHPISVMYSLVWNAKQDILLARSEADLERIRGQFDMATHFSGRDRSEYKWLMCAIRWNSFQKAISQICLRRSFARICAAIGRTHILAAFSLPDNPVRGRLVYPT